MRAYLPKMVAVALLAALPGVAHADEPGPAGGEITRQQLARVLTVLRLQPSAAGASCLDSLRDMHKTEDQIKALQVRAKDPDKALAQDVLESDYENSKEICGADAAHLCSSGSPVAGLAAACNTMRHAERN